MLCRSCERVCPAMVPYGRLVDTTRGMYGGKNSSGFALLMLKGVSHNRSLNQAARTVLELYQATGLQHSGLANILKLEQINRLLPVKHGKIAANKGFFPATTQCKGDVG